METQTKIVDSKSWVSSLRHFARRENNLVKQFTKQQQKILSEKQYVLVATFDLWLAIRQIDVGITKWNKLVDMKMSMPVVNSFIQFDKLHNPINIVLAYFDGSVEYCPFEKIVKYYTFQIQGGKIRRLQKTYPQILTETQRPAYVNKIQNESESINEAFSLQKICFLHKMSNLIYILNYKSQLKILKAIQRQGDLKQVQRIRFDIRIVEAQFLFEQLNEDNESLLVAICFERITTPFIIDLYQKITSKNLQLKIEAFYQNLSSQQINNSQNIKHICYDSNAKLLFTCTEENQIMVYSLEKVQLNSKKFIILPRIEKIFSIENNGKLEAVNDLSIKSNHLLILGEHSFHLYDNIEGIIVKEGQRLRDVLDIGKLVIPFGPKGKPIFLIKKKFNVFDPKQRVSTTLHLFEGR